MENLKNKKTAFFTTKATRKKDDAGETYWLKKTQGTLIYIYIERERETIYRWYLWSKQNKKKLMYKVNVKNY